MTDDEYHRTLEEIGDAGLGAMIAEAQMRGLELTFAFSTFRVSGLPDGVVDSGTGAYGDELETERDLLAELLLVCKGLAASLGMRLDLLAGEIKGHG